MSFFSDHLVSQKKPSNEVIDAALAEQYRRAITRWVLSFVDHLPSLRKQILGLPLEIKIGDHKDEIREAIEALPTDLILKIWLSMPKRE